MCTQAELLCENGKAKELVGDEPERKVFRERAAAQGALRLAGLHLFQAVEAAVVTCMVMDRLCGEASTLEAVQLVSLRTPR